LYRYDQSIAGGSWSAAQSMGGTWPSAPVVGIDSSDALHVFLVGNDTVLYRYDQTAPIGCAPCSIGTWSIAQSMSGTWHGTPVVSANSTGGLSVFMVGNDTELYRYDQNGPAGAWSPAQSMAGTWHGTPVVLSDTSGALHVFLVGNDTALYRYDQNGPGGSWSPAQSMAGTWHGTPVVVGDTSGALHVFLVGNDTALYRYDQNGLGGAWSPAQSMAGTWNGAIVISPGALSPSPTPLQTGLARYQFPGVWGGPAYYGGPGGPYIYYGGNHDYLRSFVLSLQAQTNWILTPSGMSASQLTWTGTTPVVSSNQGMPGTGIVWAIVRKWPDPTKVNDDLHLWAFDALKMGSPLFDMDCGHWTTAVPHEGGPFIEPTVVNGKVYVGSDGSLTVFGLEN
jgi:hypothetical protein